MQISTRKINKTIEKQLNQMMIQALCEVDDPDKMAEIINDLFTETERVAVMKRLGIAIYLDKGRSYEDIKNNLMVSSATIATVAENMAGAGIGELLKLIKAEQWANAWTDKISRGIKKIIPV